MPACAAPNGAGEPAGPWMDPREQRPLSARFAIGGSVCKRARTMLTRSSPPRRPFASTRSGFVVIRRTLPCRLRIRALRTAAAETHAAPPRTTFAHVWSRLLCQDRTSRFDGPNLALSRNMDETELDKRRGCGACGNPPVSSGAPYAVSGGAINRRRAMPPARTHPRYERPPALASAARFEAAPRTAPPHEGGGYARDAASGRTEDGAPALQDGPAQSLCRGRSKDRGFASSAPLKRVAPRRTS